jgi:hypothetical protein
MGTTAVACVFGELACFESCLIHEVSFLLTVHDHYLPTVLTRYPSINKKFAAAAFTLRKKNVAALNFSNVLMWVFQRISKAPQALTRP